jgi:hypothetical protein
MFYRYLVLNVAESSINRGSVIFMLRVFYDSHGEASLKNLLFQVPGDTVGFRLNEGDP